MLWVIMLGNTYDTQVCSAARALEVVGERWTLLIVRDALFAQSRSFGDFRGLGIATNVLSTRLKTLVDSGLLTREGDAYLLTDAGRDLATVVIALTDWGDRWLAPSGPPVRYTHTRCGGHVGVSPTCDGCDAEPEAAGIHARPGPGMPPDLAERVNARVPPP